MAAPLHESDEVELACPAKVNLALSVGPPDEASGMHAIASWMIAVSLCDYLRVRRLSRDAPSRFDIGFAEDAAVMQAVDWPPERDLAVRAHAAVERVIGSPLPVVATLRKRVPAGAGLGGGSADAAGTLLALDRLFALNLAADTLHRIAAGLGSDVTFALAAMRGRGMSAVATGLGGWLEFVPLARPLHLVLILPSLHCGTPAVYAALDRLRPDAAPPDEARVRTMARFGDVGDLFNDLAAPAEAVEPRLRAMRDAVERAVGRRPHVTGSGAACFLIAEDARKTEAIAARVRERAGVACLPVRSSTERAEATNGKV